jgi:hypothetical protein
MGYPHLWKIYSEFHDVPCVHVIYIYTYIFRLYLGLVGDIPNRITNVWLLGIALILYLYRIIEDMFQSYICLGFRN